MDRDIPEALYWFMRAARNGDKDAEHSIANLKANFEVSPVVEQQVKFFIRNYGCRMLLSPCLRLVLVSWRTNQLNEQEG